MPYRRTRRGRPREPKLDAMATIYECRPSLHHTQGEAEPNYGCMWIEVPLGIASLAVFVLLGKLFAILLGAGQARTHWRPSRRRGRAPDSAAARKPEIVARRNPSRSPPASPIRTRSGPFRESVPGSYRPPPPIERPSVSGFVVLWARADHIHLDLQRRALNLFGSYGPPAVFGLVLSESCSSPALEERQQRPDLNRFHGVPFR